MPREQKEISSTEQLIELIRREDNGHFADPEYPGEKEGIFARLLPSKKQHVGVDIGPEHIKLTRISSLKGTGFLVTALADEKIPPGTTSDQEEFVDFLKAKLKRFCGSSKNIRIWTSAPSAGAEIRHLIIPKVAKKQLFNTVYWSFKKEIPFNDKEFIFDFHIVGELKDAAGPKLRVIAYAVPMLDMTRVKSIFEKAGYPLHGITLAPFAIQNLSGLGLINPDRKNYCSIYLGKNWSRIDIFSNDFLFLSRGVKTGGSSFIDAIKEKIAEKSDSIISPGQPEDALILEKPEKESETEEKARALYGLLCGNAADSVIDGFTAPDVFKMCTPAVDRLVRQVERTISHFTLNYKGETLSRIYLSGEICGSDYLLTYLEEQLGIEILRADPFPDNVQFADGIRPPEDVGSRNSYTLAVGLALCDRPRTPNLLFTYADQEKAEKTRRLNRSVLLLLTLCVALSIGAIFWLQREEKIRREEIARLQNTLDAYKPQVDQEMIRMLAARIKEKRIPLKLFKERHILIAGINEAVALKPEPVRFVRIRAWREKDGTKKSKEAQEHTPRLLVDAVILSKESDFSNLLASYLLSMKNSPLFRSIRLVDKKNAYFENRPVLRFNMEAVLN